jgi:hypothetical protein
VEGIKSYDIYSEEITLNRSFETGCLPETSEKHRFVQVS